MRADRHSSPSKPLPTAVGKTFRSRPAPDHNVRCETPAFGDAVGEPMLERIPAGCCNIRVCR